MRRLYLPSPYSILEVTWAVLSSTLAHALTRRRLPAALLTGAFMSALPAVEDRIRRNPLYDRLIEAYYRLDERGDEEYERQRQRLIDEYSFYLEPWPLPPLRTLLRVVAVGQEQRLEGGTLLVTTLESYAEGCIVFVRLLLDEAPEEADAGDEEQGLGMPELVLSASDDRVHRYRVGSVMSSNGGGGGEGVEYYWEFRVLEPLDPEARELILVVAELEWRGIDPSIDHPLIRSGQTGPWTFRVAL